MYELNVGFYEENGNIVGVVQCLKGNYEIRDKIKEVVSHKVSTTQWDWVVSDDSADLVDWPDLTAKNKKQALKLSIHKWLSIYWMLLEGYTNIDGCASESCACCEWDSINGIGECFTCPIYKYVSKTGCKGTPFTSSPTISSAKAEIEFLYMLYKNT